MQSLIYFLLVAALFVVMMRFGCGAHVMGHGHRHGRTDGAEPGPGDTGRWTAPARDRDPVCGMTVDTASAKSSLYGGAAYYFCSTACRDKFETSPGTYVKGRPQSPQAKEIAHGSHH